MCAAATVPDDRLPPLRDELRFLGRSSDPRGEPVWLVYDPVANRYIELQPFAYALLSRWSLGTVHALIDAVKRETVFFLDEAGLRMFIQFLRDRHFLRGLKTPKRADIGWGTKLQKALSSVVFFRVPLVRPDAVLARMSEILAFLFMPAFWWTTAAMGIAGLALILRQWDQFTMTFVGFLDFEGLSIILIAVVCAKIVHEFGHALSAKRQGCYVPGMGVAFVLGLPMAYTDVSDTWRLKQRHERVLVSAGGILAETLLAVFATWGWLILPDGPARAACFVLAATGWIATLVINLNPFMRFDGYYILADALGLRNLQDRSFTMGKWALRTILLGWDAPPPETGSARLRRFLIAFAWMTWFIRACIYLGIAVFAYVMFGKTFGTLIAALEVYLLLYRPVAAEFKAWIKGLDQWRTKRRAWISVVALISLAAIMAIPFRYTLTLPAVLTPERSQWIHAPRAAIVEANVADRATVRHGDKVLELQNPELDHQISQSRLRLELIDLAMRQITTQDAARQLAVLANQRAQEATTLNGLVAQRRAMSVLAPFDGRVAEMRPMLKPGFWVEPTQPQFLVVDDTSVRLQAYVTDRNRKYVAVGERVRFYPHSPDFPSYDGTIEKVQSVPESYLTEPILASTSGGPISVIADDQHRLIPTHGLYQITVNLQSAPDRLSTVLRGTLHGRSVPYSLLELAFDRVRSIFARESGY